MDPWNTAPKPHSSQPLCSYVLCPILAIKEVTLLLLVTLQVQQQERGTLYYSERGSPDDTETHLNSGFSALSSPALHRARPLFNRHQDSASP